MAPAISAGEQGDVLQQFSTPFMRRLLVTSPTFDELTTLDVVNETFFGEADICPNL
jgi:hypothetical protein